MISPQPQLHVHLLQPIRICRISCPPAFCKTHVSVASLVFQDSCSATLPPQKGTSTALPTRSHQYKDIRLQGVRSAPPPKSAREDGVGVVDQSSLLLSIVPNRFRGRVVVPVNFMAFDANLPPLCSQVNGQPNNYLNRTLLYFPQSPN